MRIICKWMNVCNNGSCMYMYMYMLILIVLLQNAEWNLFVLDWNISKLHMYMYMYILKIVYIHHDHTKMFITLHVVWNQKSFYLDHFHMIILVYFIFQSIVSLMSYIIIRAPAFIIRISVHNNSWVPRELLQKM